MIRTKNRTTAITSKTWMNPPIVCAVTNPKSQRTIITTAIVPNILPHLINAEFFLVKKTIITYKV